MFLFNEELGNCFRNLSAFKKLQHHFERKNNIKKNTDIQ